MRLTVFDIFILLYSLFPSPFFSILFALFLFLLHSLFSSYPFGGQRTKQGEGPHHNAPYSRNPQSAINNKQFTLSVMIDLEKAFDLDWHKGLLYNMKQVGLPGIVFKFVEDFLKDHSIQVRVGAAMSSTYFLECNASG